MDETEKMLRETIAKNEVYFERRRHRIQFAAAALTGIIQNQALTKEMTISDCAAMAWAFAQAMLNTEPAPTKEDREI